MRTEYQPTIGPKVPQQITWYPMQEAPKDGREILVRRDNGCAVEHCVVWWGSDPQYPWASYGNAFTADRWDEWAPVPS